MRKFLSLILIFLFLSSGVLAASAVPDELNVYLEELKATVPEISLPQCQQITEIYDIEVLNFLSFLEQTFENKSSTSSLSNIAISRYAEYKANLEDVLAQLVPNESEFDTLQEYQTNFQNYAKCVEITDFYIEIAKDRMMQHIRNNAAVKRTTVLLEKFHSLNEKMRELNFSIAEMYSFFATFKNRLPGFLTNCVTSP